MAKTIVGLEVTEESVRAAEVSLGRKPQLIAYGEVPLPPEAARDSEVLDPGAVAVALRQLWTGARFKSKDVVLGVASRRILVREYTTQAMRPDLLREALPYQVQDLLPVPASQAVLDFYPLVPAGRSGLGAARRRRGGEHRADHRDALSSEAARAGRRPRRVRARPRHRAARAARRDGRDGEHRRPHDAGRRRARRRAAVRATAADRRRHAPRVATAVDEVCAEPALEYACRDRHRARVARCAPQPHPASPISPLDCAARSRSSRAARTRTPLSQVFVTGAGAAAEGVHAGARRRDRHADARRYGRRRRRDVGAPLPGELGLNLVSTVGIALGEVALMAASLAPAFAGLPRVNLMPRSEVARRERDKLVRRWVWVVFGAILVALLIIAGAFWLKFVGRPAARRRAGADERAARRDRLALGGEPGAGDRGRAHRLPHRGDGHGPRMDAGARQGHRRPSRRHDPHRLRPRRRRRAPGRGPDARTGPRRDGLDRQPDTHSTSSRSSGRCAASRACSTPTDSRSRRAR